MIREVKHINRYASHLCERVRPSIHQSVHTLVGPCVILSSKTMKIIPLPCWHHHILSSIIATVYAHFTTYVWSYNNNNNNNNNDDENDDENNNDYDNDNNEDENNEGGGQGQTFFDL